MLFYSQLSKPQSVRTYVCVYVSSLVSIRTFPSLLSTALSPSPTPGNANVKKRSSSIDYIPIMVAVSLTGKGGGVGGATVVW